MKKLHTILSENNFNSIKVQLELMRKNAPFEPLLFQFHKGTIRTGSMTQCKARKVISIP